MYLCVSNKSKLSKEKVNVCCERKVSGESLYRFIDAFFKASPCSFLNKIFRSGLPFLLLGDERGPKVAQVALCLSRKITHNFLVFS